MNLDHPPDADREQAQGYVTDAVRQGVALAKLDWERHLSDEHIVVIDERIDRKIDKVKLWLFGGVLATIAANFIPLAIMAYQFGSFTGEIRNQLANLNDAAPTRYTQTEHETYANEVNRRFTEAERRMSELELYHRGIK